MPSGFDNSLGGVFIVSATAGCVGTVLLLLLPFITYTTTQDLDRAATWKDQEWTGVNCTVVVTGLAYRGSCQTWAAHKLGLTNYTECTGTGARAQDSPWYNPGKRMIGTECIEHSDYAWEHAAERRLGRGCTDKVLPWALVALPDGRKRCAFRWGAEWPSIEEDRRSADRFYLNDHFPGQRTTCYMLPPPDDCTPALEHPMDGIQEWYRGNYYRMWTVCGVCFGICCLGGCLSVVGVLVSSEPDKTGNGSGTDSDDDED